MPNRAIDLFCGAGGLTCGLSQAGIDVIAGIDFDDSCRYAYSHNNNSIFIHKRIQDVTSQEIESLFEDNDVRILVGCAPCQPFSSHSNNNKKREKNKKIDERWYLINDFLRLIIETNPDIVSMENVPNLVGKQIFKSFVNRLRRHGFSVTYKIVFCPDYGIPQNRQRLVLLASRHGKINLIPPTHGVENYRTVRNTIGDLQPIEAGEISQNDAMHRSAGLSELNMKRIKASKPGGTWKDWNKNLLCECHKKHSGKTYGSVYARMEWDQPAPTITTEFYNYGTGRFGHPVQDRAISLREGALLQTFPNDYEFLPEKELSYKQIGKMVGNAVPVELGRVVGISILDHIRSWRGQNE